MDQLETLSNELISSPMGRGVNPYNRALTEPEKAAVIIAMLGPENAGPVVEKIEDNHMRAFMTALENLHQIPREKMLAVVAEFITELRGRKGGFKGGPEAARALVSEMFPQDRVTRLFGTPPPPPVQRTNADVVWSMLNKRPVEDLAKYLGAQRVEVAAVVMSQLNTGKTGELLSELPEDFSVQCVARMSHSSGVDQSAIDGVAELIEIEFFNGEEDTDESANAVAYVGELLGILPSARRDKVLEALEATDPRQAALVRATMFTFEDLKTRLPVTAIPIIFRDFDQSELVRMLKAGAEQQPEIINFLYENISQRMAGDYKEQVDDLGSLTEKQGDAAISSLMGFINKLEKDGRVVLIKVETEDAA